MDTRDDNYWNASFCCTSGVFHRGISSEKINRINEKENRKGKYEISMERRRPMNKTDVQIKILCVAVAILFLATVIVVGLTLSVLSSGGITINDLGGAFPPIFR